MTTPTTPPQSPPVAHPGQDCLAAITGQTVAERIESARAALALTDRISRPNNSSVRAIVLRAMSAPDGAKSDKQADYACDCRAKAIESMGRGIPASSIAGMLAVLAIVCEEAAKLDARTCIERAEPTLKKALAGRATELRAALALTD